MAASSAPNRCWTSSKNPRASRPPGHCQPPRSRRRNLATTRIKQAVKILAAAPLHCGGHSQVTVPFKGVLLRCNHNREAMPVQSVDTAILADAETAYAIRQDLKKGLSLDA